MELRSLRYFAAVVEAGSLSTAAVQLHISQPSLSVAVSRLESEVGVPLLTRSSRGVEPTGAGRYLLDAASRVLGEADEIVATLRRYGSGVEGTVRFAAVPVLMWARVPRFLRVYSEEAPGVEVRLEDPPPWTAIDLLQQRRIDLAAILVADPQRFAKRYRNEFDIVDWGEVPLVAVLPPDGGDAPEPLPLIEFERAVLMLPQRTAAVPSLPEAVEETFRRQGVAPRAIRTAATIQAGVPLIEAGLAWGILPDPDGSSLARFDVIRRSLAPAPDPLRALVLARRGATADPTIGRLLGRLSAEGARGAPSVPL